MAVVSSLMGSPSDPRPPLDRARTKAYRRLMPLLFLSYMVAYVDRTNVAIVGLTMQRDLPGFDSEVFGFGMGVFFAGYFLLEIPGTLIVERWSARKWISRIMISWGFLAALTALVKTPMHFYTVRFLLGLAEAGFYPGVIVYLTHWFPSRDRTRALAYFFVATPIAQMVSPKLSNLLLSIGTDEVVDGVTVHHPEVWGLEGWQWVFIAWGVPAVILGLAVLFLLTDKPGQARWLQDDEREALEAELRREKALSTAGGHMTVGQALSNPKVLILAGAYFCAVTGNYGVEFFMPKILERWYDLNMNRLTWLVVLPPLGSLIGQLFVGWNSDRTGERRFHTVLPMYLGAVSLALLAIIPAPPLAVTLGLFLLALTGLKAYLPAFWSLPSLFLAESAAAGSIGFINSVGNLGGWIGPWMLGRVDRLTGSFRGGLTVLAVSISVAATIILLLGVGRRVRPTGQSDPVESLADDVVGSLDSKVMRTSHRLHAGILTLGALIMVGWMGCDLGPPRSLVPASPLSNLVDLNLGSVRRGSKASAPLRVANTTTRAWWIDRVESSCSCLKVRPASFAIDPGATALIDISFDSTSEPDFRGNLLVKIEGKGTDGTVIFRSQIALVVEN